MDLSAWVLYTFIAALVLTAAVLHYRWREPDGSGRVALGLLRGGVLALVVLLLFDPLVRAAPEERPVVALLDVSLSMGLPDRSGTRRWAAALDEVAALAPDRVQPFGTAEQPAVDDLSNVEPTAPRSRLAPALRRALEAAPARVVVVTDGALDDPAEVRRLAADARVPVEVRTVGSPSRPNLAVASVEAPSWLEVGEPAAVRVVVERSGAAAPGGGEGALPETADVVLTRNGAELARGEVAVPEPGRTTSLELTVGPDSAAPGPVRLDVRVEPGGAESDDDVRSIYVRIAEEPAGVAVVSFRPDQEPRFLLPVLERSLGLPARGWLALAGDRFIAVAAGADAGLPADAATVRQAVAEASLVVLHGLSAEAPFWAIRAAATAERVLVFPADPAPPLPLDVGPLRAGDWYLTPDLPSSPVAPLLVGIEAEPVPPLTGLRSADPGAEYWAPLEARAGRRGSAASVLVAGRADGRRIAVALGTGYWRWAFSGGAARDAYERLWSAVAGWLMESAVGVDPERVRPLDRVVSRGEPVRWLAAGDSLRVVVRRDTGPEGASGADPAVEAVVDTVVATEAGRARTGVLPPGHYRYMAESGERSGEGSFTVESYSRELVAQPTSLDLSTTAAGLPDRVRYGRPLHTTAWPYVLIAAMLCLEWALRRRWGLR